MIGVPTQGAIGRGGESLAAFQKSYESLLQEERNLRALAEDRARSYAQLLAELGRLLDAQEMDRRRRADPLFPNSLDPSQWRDFLRGSWGGGPHHKPVRAGLIMQAHCR